MTNPMTMKSPNLVRPIPRRNNEEVDIDTGIIYPPGYSVASPIPIDEPNIIPVAPAVLIDEPNIIPVAPAVLIEEPSIHNAEEGRLPTQKSEESHSKKTDSRFDPFRPIHPQCNHISYGCLTMVFIVFVGMAVLLKTYIPDILPQSNNDNGVIPSIDNEDIKSYDSYQPSPYLAADPLTNPPSMSIKPSPSPSFLTTVTRSNPPSMYPSHPPSITKYEVKKFVASDGSVEDWFGRSCSMSGDLVVVGANGADDYEGAAYLFHMDGTEVRKLTPGNDGQSSDYINDYFGWSVSMDKKTVVGSPRSYIRVFSRYGTYERTIRCDDCSSFGRAVATHGNLIVTSGYQNSTSKIFIYTTEDGQLLKSLDQGSDNIWDVAISEQFIVSTARDGKTIIYSNTSPDFPKVAEIDQGGKTIAVAGDRIVIGYGNANNNDYDGAAYLYKTDGTLVTALDIHDSESRFGTSVAITDDKVLVGAKYNDDGSTGSVFIYSAATGEFVEKVLTPDGEANDRFGSSVCASHSYFVVGAFGDDNSSGAAYWFQFSE
jgi:hypothetical protein